MNTLIFALAFLTSIYSVVTVINTWVTNKPNTTGEARILWLSATFWIIFYFLNH